VKFGNPSAIEAILSPGGVVSIDGNVPVLNAEGTYLLTAGIPATQLTVTGTGPNYTTSTIPTGTVSLLIVSTTTPDSGFQVTGATSGISYPAAPGGVPTGYIAVNTPTVIPVDAGIDTAFNIASFRPVKVWASANIPSYAGAVSFVALNVPSFAGPYNEALVPATSGSTDSMSFLTKLNYVLVPAASATGDARINITGLEQNALSTPTISLEAGPASTGPVVGCLNFGEVGAFVNPSEGLFVAANATTTALDLMMVAGSVTTY
jgi:hypothetical protein